MATPNIRRILFRIALALIGLIATGSPAYASNWSMNASSCVPNHTSIGHYFVTGGSVTHAQGSTTLITLYCPITGTWGSNKPTFLSMTIMNNKPFDELRQPDAHITAQIIRLVASTGTLNKIGPPLNSPGRTIAIGEKIQGQLFAHTFDFMNSYYYVRVDISRKSTAGFAKLFGVGMSCLTCPAN
jgi:hypothetical protein